MNGSVSLSVRDLQRLGELQMELAGAADFCATYLRCQLLLMKVCVCVSVYHALINTLRSERKELVVSK